MSERVVKIKLEADASGAVKGIAATRDAAAELKTKIADSARSQRAEWATVGTGLTAVGVAVTGIGIAAVKTGIEYNTLQQTTRAALTSLLGGAKAANAQMDRLDDFARNSPFSKATFIKAQQQMLAFGIETKKVIPYLDGVQNAVAAAGGSNADIEGIVATMSKIQSSSKITATDLMEFGNRGVNAADLIGSQMGKTGAQIREDITAGTLKASDALDALANGMSQKYAGAADNVKNTFAGAMDRVKAAWRDFGAELARPLVDPNGGGALVGLLNWAADMMRAFEDLPGPVKTTASALTGLAGGGALLLGTSMLLVPKILEFGSALKVLTAQGSAARMFAGGFASFLTGPYGVALMAAASVTTLLASENAKLTGLARELADTLDESTGAITANSKAWAANQLQQEGVLSGAKRLGISAKDMTDAWLGNDAALKRVNARLDKFRNDSDFRMNNTNWKGWSDDLADVSYALDGSNKVLAEAKTRHQELAEATDETAQATGTAGDAAANVAGQFSDEADAAKSTAEQILGLLDALNELNGIGQSSEKANAALQDSYESMVEYVAKAQEGAEGYALSLDEWTAAGSANRAMLADHAASVESNAKAQFDLESKTLGVAAASANFESRLSAGRQQLYDTALALTGNAEEAQKLTDKLLAMPDQKAINVLLNGAAEAEATLQRLSQTREATINVAMNSVSNMLDTFGKLGKSTGGIIGYAHGGVVGYAGGGVLPGYDPIKRDTILTPMRKGEGVLVPEVVRGLGPSTIHALNAAGNSGGVSAVRALMAPEAPPMTAASFAPSVIVQQPQVINNPVVQVPTELTVVDAKGALIGKMQVVANQVVDTFVQQSAQENRRAGR